LLPLAVLLAALLGPTLIDLRAVETTAPARDADLRRILTHLVVVEPAA